MLRRRDVLRNGLAAAVGAPTVLRSRPASAQSGRTVRIGTVSPLNAFDPLRFSEAFIMRAVFPPLTRIVAKTGDALSGWEPYAATPSKPGREENRDYMDISAMPQRDWPRRRNTVHEIIRGIERAKRLLPTAFQDILKAVTEFKVADDHTCRAYLAGFDNRIYKEIFSRSWTTPLTASVQDALERRDHPTSLEALGPYVFTDPFRAGEIVTLKANPIWKRQSPVVETFSIRRVASDNVAAAGLLANELDMVFLSDEAVWASPTLRSSDFQALVNVESRATDSVSYVAIELGNSVSDNQRVREAVRAGIDPNKAVETAYGAAAEATSDILPSGFVKEKQSPSRWYDANRARRLLSEAGYPQGFDGRWLISQQAGEADRRIGQNIRDQLNQLNIRLKEEVVSFQANRPDRESPTFFLARTPIAQTAAQVFANFTTRSPTNWPRMASPQFDKSVQDLTFEAEKWEPLAERSRKILEDEAVLVPLFQRKNALVARRGLRASFAPDGTLGDLVDVTWTSS